MAATEWCEIISSGELWSDARKQKKSAGNGGIKFTPRLASPSNDVIGCVDAVCT